MNKSLRLPYTSLSNPECHTGMVAIHITELLWESVKDVSSVFNFINDGAKMWET